MQVGSDLYELDPSAGGLSGHPVSALVFQRVNCRGCVFFSVNHLLYSLSQAVFAAEMLFFHAISSLRFSSCLQFTPAQRSHELTLFSSVDVGVANLLNDPPMTENPIGKRILSSLFFGISWK